MTLIEELRLRGLLQDIMPGTEEYLTKNKVKAYVGFDPTADSLHIGNLVPMILLRHLQNYGHTPYALVGGATGMVGDPSGKSDERPVLSEEILAHNQRCVTAQLQAFLDFETPVNPAKIVNNYDWFKGMGFLEFLRDVGKLLTVNYMMAKDSVKNRIEKEQGISYTEFTYQLVQGYDFYHLFKHEGVTLQMGGSDQWGNITTGTELIRRKEGHEAQAFAFTVPLVTREDGTKFGKTADGKNVWLDANRTSPYHFYQFWLNVSDNDAEKYIRIFTFLPLDEIQALIEKHKENPSARELHKRLAAEVTALIHGSEGVEKAIAVTKFLFNSNISPETLQELSITAWEDILSNFADNDRKSLSSTQMQAGLTLTDLLADTGISTSKGDARRTIQQDKAVKVNGVSITDPNFVIDAQSVLHGRFIFVQKGKKNKFIIEV